jgi:hypothetical protein
LSVRVSAWKWLSDNIRLWLSEYCADLTCL